MEECVSIVGCWEPRVQRQGHEGALLWVALWWEWCTVTRLHLTDVRAGRFSVWQNHWGKVGEVNKRPIVCLLTYSGSMLSTLSNSEEPMVSAEWNAHCCAVKRLYRAMRAVFLKTPSSNPVFRDLADLMERWDQDRGVHDTLTRVCDAWNDTLEVAERRQLNVETLHVVAGVLVRVGLFTGGTDFITSYELLYALV
jgi:hypothetical protein